MWTILTPAMTLNNNQDQLFTLTEMQKADGILKQVFSRAGAPEKYQGRFYDGPHKFDAAMQAAGDQLPRRGGGKAIGKRVLEGH